ncbi:MAG TPA: glycosyltransferase [Anaerohalosphaeraceae bacterium]|nr:glycosyltransferase [Anaerohalosphaeraceae bacterium]
MVKSKYNLMFVTASLQIGGLETYLVNVLKVLDRSIFSPLVVYNGLGRDDYLPVLHDMAIPVHKIPNSPWQVDYYSKVKKIIREYSVDIVCDFRDDFCAPTLIAAGLAGVKSRVAMYRSSRTCFKPTWIKNAYASIMHTLVSLTATRMIGNTSKVLANYYGDWKSNKKCAVVHNGVPIDEYLAKKDKTRVRTELGIPENAFVIGHVGRFHESKNHDTLIKVFSKVKQQCQSAHLLLVGDGALRPQIEACINENAVGANTIITGLRTDIARLHAAMDVFAYPSLYEGMPTAFVEAMISGLPFVASNIEEITEIVPPELQGQLLNPYDVNMMAEAIMKLNQQADQRINCGAIAQRWSMDRFSIEKSVQQLCGHLLVPFKER